MCKVKCCLGVNLMRVECPACGGIMLEFAPERQQQQQEQRQQQQDTEHAQSELVSKLEQLVQAAATKQQQQ